VSATHIPNLLGLFRIITTPLLVIFILSGTAAGYIAAFVLLLLMAASDIIDGRLARSLQVVSPLGVFLDTTSDKIFVTATLIPMVQTGLMGWAGAWIAAIIIVRDFVISGLRSFAAAEGEVIAARSWGKQKLVFTVVALCWCLLNGAVQLLPGTPAWFVTLCGLWWIPMILALIWTVGSGTEYLWKAWPLLVGRKASEQPPARIKRVRSNRAALLAILARRRRSAQG
jgi:CDP-diacylglycerol--glycerol-3-phosphate 3-phosphatidyltransferase